MLSKNNFPKTIRKPVLSAYKAVFIRKGLIFLILLLLIPFASGSILKAQNPKWKVYSTSNSGLPDNDIHCLAVDRSGNTWIGTGDGLVKYDGTNWTVYNTSNSGLPDNPVNCLAVDGSGNVWIGTDLGGLVKYDSTNWTVYDTSNSGLPDNDVQCLYIDGSGNIWSGTGSGGLAKYDGTNPEGTGWTVYNTSNSGLPDNDVWCLDIDGSGNVWIGTWEGMTGIGGLAKYDVINWTVYNESNSGLWNNYVKCLTVDDSGNIWIGTGDIMEMSGVLAKFDGSNFTIYNSSNSGFPYYRGINVNCIVVDRNNNIWIGILAGETSGEYGVLVKCDGTNCTDYNTTTLGLPNIGVNCLAIDGRGNKWIGTNGGGLAVFNEGGIVSSIKSEDNKINYPDKFILSQNYPNPFNPSTTIKYSIPKQAYVTLKVYDILGREVATLVNEEKPAGNYEVEFSPASGIRNLASGIFFYQIKAGDYVCTKKMNLLK